METLFCTPSRTPPTRVDAYEVFNAIAPLKQAQEPVVTGQFWKLNRTCMKMKGSWPAEEKCLFGQYYRHLSERSGSFYTTYSIEEVPFFLCVRVKCLLFLACDSRAGRLFRDKVSILREADLRRSGNPRRR